MIHSVIVEMRPRLQVCNVFIITDEYLKQDEHVRINIRTSLVEITWQSGTCERVQVINLHEYKLKPLSLSTLQVLKKSISFRIQTEPVVNVVGSFSSEILSIEQNSDMITNATVKLFTPCIRTDRPCQLACKCCGKVISKQDTLFTRVLPLPSSASWEVSEWFCHQHSGSSSLQLSVLAPKKSDCLYGMCYILVNASVLNIRSEKVVRCNRCLAWLGTCINSTAVKLWNCTTAYDGNNSAALEDFIYIVTQASDKSCTMNCRLILETKLSEEHSQYLLLWVMDKNLDLLVSADKDISHIEENAGKVVLERKLKVKRTMKLLYMYRKDCDSMVKTWQRDCNVECFEVAKPMFIEGLAYLVRGTEFIPAPYKLTNNFFVTYLGL